MDKPKLNNDSVKHLDFDNTHMRVVFNTQQDMWHYIDKVIPEVDYSDSVRYSHGAVDVLHVIEDDDNTLLLVDDDTYIITFINGNELNHEVIAIVQMCNMMKDNSCKCSGHWATVQDFIRYILD